MIKKVEGFGPSMEDLLAFCRGGKRVLLYGTGAYAEIVQSFLDQNNITAYGFVVSDGRKSENPERYLGLPVFSLSEIALPESECGFVLGLEEKHHQEVARNLAERQFSRCYPITNELLKDIWAAREKEKLSGDVKIVLGSGGTGFEGWVSTDRCVLDVLDERDWSRYFAEGSIGRLLAEHVWEHFTPEQARRAAVLCRRYLKVGGCLRIAVPDGFHPSSAYIESVKPGGDGAGAEDHKVLYTYKSLSDLLLQAGFSVRLIEYFDENREFHRRPMRDEDGYISRSSLHDERNAGGELSYTSLIIDAMKE